MIDLLNVKNWKPIEDAPLDKKTHVLLACFYGEKQELRTIDYGCFDFIEYSDWDGSAVHGWVTINDNDCEWTHFLIV